MSYRLSTPIKPLIWAEASVETHRGSRVEYTVKVRAQFKRKSTANNVEIYVPVPEDSDTPRFRVSRDDCGWKVADVIDVSWERSLCAGEVSVHLED